MTLEQFIRHATHQLAAVSPSPRLDAEVLLMHVTGLARTALITRAQEPLSPVYEERLRGLLAHRACGEPVAYLTGRREFWSMELHITPDVLIPRPETELLVEQALHCIPVNVNWTIADLGTGSGAVALAIAKERPRCRVLATDASSAALAVARANALQLAVSSVEFRSGEWLAALKGEVFDMIVSNPPYVAENDPHLAAGDVRFEPRAALVSGADGLDAIRHIAAGARHSLKPGGWLLLEHGADQDAAVTGILVLNHYQNISTRRDLSGHARLTFGRRA
jgi:release factor glutamine methyltransferase